MDKDMLTGVIVLIALLACIIALIVIVIRKIVQKIRGDAHVNSGREKRAKEKRAKEKPKKEKKKSRFAGRKDNRNYRQGPSNQDSDGTDELTSLMQKRPIEEDDDDSVTVLMRHARNTVRIQLAAEATGVVYSAVCDDQISIGRKGECDITIVDDKTVSGRHCAIKRMEDGTFSIVDTGSTNGTFLNNQKIKENMYEHIASGDLLKIGRTRYIVSIQ